MASFSKPHGGPYLALFSTLLNMYMNGATLMSGYESIVEQSRVFPLVGVVSNRPAFAMAHMDPPIQGAVLLLDGTCDAYLEITSTPDLSDTDRNCCR